MYRISASLLNSWNYALESGDLNSFISYLKKEKVETTANMQKGIDFEDLVIRGEDEEFSPIVKGGTYQPHISRLISVENTDVLLHGYLDVLKGGVIYDIKYTGKYQVGKYFKSMQHPIYLYLVPEAKKFVYLIQSNGNHYKEEYEQDLVANENKIRNEIKMFFNWLKERQDLFELFEKNFKA